MVSGTPTTLAESTPVWPLTAGNDQRMMGNRERDPCGSLRVHLIPIPSKSVDFSRLLTKDGILQLTFDSLSINDLNAKRETLRSSLSTSPHNYTQINTSIESYLPS